MTEESAKAETTVIYFASKSEMEKLLFNPRELADFLNREITALDRLVEEALARNQVKKPVQSVSGEEMEMAARA